MLLSRDSSLYGLGINEDYKMERVEGESIFGYQHLET